MITYKEMVDMLVDYVGASTSEETDRYARQAVQRAIRELHAQRRWTYYTSRLRVTTVAVYTTGTVEYDHTGGTYERMLTITDGTWPTWATFGRVIIANIPYEVAEYKSATQITLTELSNPGADVASGTSFQLYRDVYPLPVDFLQMDDPCIIDQTGVIMYVHPNEWMLAQQSVQSTGTPRMYTITGDPNYMGQLSLGLYPAPDTVYVIDSMYNRMARRLNLVEYNTGTISVGASGTTVTGTGTAWTSSMAGSVIRFSSDTTNIPTGRSGANPYTIESMIMSVESATSLTIDAVTGTAFSGTKYSISDPIDIMDQMFDLFTLECYKQMRLARRIKPTPEEMAEYERVRVRAYEADSPNAAPRAESGERYRRSWLRDAIISSSLS